MLQIRQPLELEEWSHIWAEQLAQLAQINEHPKVSDLRTDNYICYKS